ncbi:unnamed protein product [Brassica napus]|uniref:(rape) hypothetical protein n=1 Tax=Brassica napus TaxID=3708 RepID=A0A816J9E1_BRANA|nr:unnamed protein product [Brassica napus]
MEVDGSDDNYDDDEDDDDDEGDESDEAVSRREASMMLRNSSLLAADEGEGWGRRQGSKKQISPEIQKRMTEAIFLHADNKDSEAFPILFDIINEAPAFGQAYYYLALVPDNLGPRSPVVLPPGGEVGCSTRGEGEACPGPVKREQGNMVLASDYVSKAVQADPEDIDLKYEYADLCLSAGKYKEAAETYEKIFRRHPEIIEPLKRGTEYFLKSGKGERAANMLEDHIKSHPSEVGPDILDLLADVLMQINAYDRALKYIHDVRQIYNLGKELPSSLKIRQAICHVRLEEMEQAEIVLNILPREAVSEHPKLIIDLADELTNIENFHSALKYYLLAINDTLNNGYLLVKAARCYMSLEKREQAIVFYYRDCLRWFFSLSVDLDTSKQKAWWKKRKIRMHLCQIYHSEGMLEEFANTALQLVLKWVLRRTVIALYPTRLRGGPKERRKIISRLGKRASSEAKFMHHLRSKHRDCVPPILIAGHHFTVTSRHQDAAREYLEAYKLMPDSPLINLCVGAALINLALGFRLKNRHECLAQGVAFLYNNIRICSNSQEALYNVARAYHHVGLVTHAASYYDKVLAIYEKEYPMPKLPNEDPNVAEERKPANCDLRKEAAHNLHLIYKHSGAFDLARQVLKDHCTF